MRIEDYEILQEYKHNRISLKYLGIIIIIAALFLGYGIYNTTQVEKEIDAGQESLAIKASQLESELEELKQQMATTTQETTIIEDEPIPSLWDGIVPDEQLPARTEQTEPLQTEPKYVVSFTKGERILFEQIVAAEAHPAWGYDGYFLIAQTVMNQLADGRWGTSLRQVLTYKGNFTVYENGRYREVDITENAKAAVDDVLQGTMPISLYNHGRERLQSILYFCTGSHLNNHPSGFHATQTEVLRYDNVVFFAKSK